MKLRPRRVATWLGALALASTAMVGTAVSSQAATTPGWEPDPNSVGSVAFYNAAGVSVTTGSTTDAPMATYFVASGSGIAAADNKAYVVFATPTQGVDPASWTAIEQFSATTVFPNTSAPANIKSLTNAVVTSTAGDGTFGDHITNFPNNSSVAGYQGLYQIRIYTTHAGGLGQPKYYSSDILVSGSTWTLVYPAPVVAVPSTYTPVTPCRVFDTRAGAGGCTTAPSVAAAPLGAGGVLAVKVTGMGGVPSDATAVVLNVTAVGATASTYVSVYPAALTPPTVSNLNVAGASPVPNLVIVPVGPGGVVDFFNKAGTVNLIADVSGYYSPTGGSLYSTVTPCRVFDTRSGTGGCSSSPTFTAGKVGPGGILKVKVTGVAGVPDAATAVVLNVTAVAATVPGTFITVYPDSPTKPVVSNLNVNDAAPVPNLVVVPVGPGGFVDFYNNRGAVSLLADLAGYFAPGAGSTYTTTGPCRVFDTRFGTGVCAGAPTFTAAKVGPAGILKIKVTGVGGVPVTATAVVLNVTAVGATVAGTFVSVYPDSPTLPTVSNLNVNNANAVPNLVVVPVGPGGFVDFYNAKGTVNLIADVAGFFSP